MPDRSMDPLDAPAVGRRPASEGTLASPTRPTPGPYDQHGFGSRLEWGLTGVRLLAKAVDLIVVVDVLSFSTAVTVAVEAGARVVPYPAGDTTARAYARSIGAILASPNRGATGPTLSPASLRGLRMGDTLVLPSPNGAACAAVAADAGAMVVAGCLRNASAVGRLLAAHGGGGAVIAAGETWPDGTLRPAVEDLIGAGAILALVDPSSLSPEARAAVGAFHAVRARLADAIRECASGRELADAGFDADLDLAAELNVTELVPVLVDGVFAGGMG